MTEIELHPGCEEGLLRLLAARDEADYGEPAFTRSVLLVAGQTSEFSLAKDSVIAVQGSEPLGGVALLPAGAIGFVAPAAEGRGVGSGLLNWVQRRAVSQGRDIHRQRVGADNDRAHALLTAHGYTQVREVRQMSIDLNRDHAQAPSPPGVDVGPVQLPADAHPLHEADGRMFAENADYEPLSFAVFRGEHLAHPSFAPDLSSVARRGDQLVGFSLCSRLSDSMGFVDVLAVDRSERRRGLGRALLIRSLSGFAATGLRTGRLEVASDNPAALSLYAAVGMTVAQRTHVFEKPVTLE
jgi:mycothiol synthase